MVSVGTVISLIAGGAIIAGGIAVFSNLGGIGSAFTRGVEESISKPFRDYLDSLFQNGATSTESNQSSIAGETVAFDNTSSVFIPGDTQVNPDGTVSSSTPPLLSLSPQEKAIATTIQQQNVILSQQALDESIASRLSGGFTGGEEGFYYFNVVGSEFDTQQFLSAESAQKLKSADPNILFNPGGLTDIKFLGKTPLQEASFKLFGESQNYL